MYVVFLHGPPAAGKHTIGTLLAARLGIPLFHNHLTVDLAKTLFAFGTPGFVALRAAVWREAFALAARERRSFFFTFNPEATVEPSMVEELASSIETTGEALLVELLCAEEVGGAAHRLGRARASASSPTSACTGDPRRWRLRVPAAAAGAHQHRYRHDVGARRYRTHRAGGWRPDDQDSRGAIRAPSPSALPGAPTTRSAQ